MQTDEKPRLVRVTDPKEIEAVAKGWAGDLGLPRGVPFIDYTDNGRVQGWYADAAELAKWRASL